MKFDELSDEEREDVASGIADLLNVFTDNGLLGGVPIPSSIFLCESCKEMIIDLPLDWLERLRESNSDSIEQWRRIDITWFHQLRSEDGPFGFARSIERAGPEGRSFDIIEVVPSQVSFEFDGLIQRIDAENQKGDREDGRSVSLLQVPRLDVYGIAASEAGKILWIHPFAGEQSHDFKALERSERGERLDRDQILALFSEMDA